MYLSAKEKETETYVWDQFSDEEEESTGGILLGILSNIYIINKESFELYLGTAFGYNSNEAFGYYGSGHIGGRYPLSKTMALFAELGFGTSLVKAGVSFGL